MHIAKMRIHKGYIFWGYNGMAIRKKCYVFCFFFFAEGKRTLFKMSL